MTVMARISRSLLVLSLLFALATPPRAVAELELAPSRKNVVSARLAGTWRIDQAATDRIYPASPADMALTQISFREDADVLELIPSKYERVFKGRPIRMVGTMRLWTREVRIFALTEAEGTPTIIWFGESGEDPFGRSGAFRVMLVSARGSADDLLYLSAGDGPALFRAYTRDVQDR